MFVWLNLGGELLIGSDSLKRQPLHTTTREFSGKAVVFGCKAQNYSDWQEVKHQLSEASFKRERSRDKPKHE